VGELLTGRRHHFVDGASNFLAHLRVEMGVDAWYADRYPEARRRRLALAFRADHDLFHVDCRMKRSDRAAWRNGRHRNRTGQSLRQQASTINWVDHHIERWAFTSADRLIGVER
jgi:hypothetical protein